MNDHDPLCPSLLVAPAKFGGMEKASCRCDLINRVRDSMKPECTCGHDDLEYIFHLQDCKQGAFLKSQDKTEWMDPDEEPDKDVRDERIQRGIDKWEEDIDIAYWQGYNNAMVEKENDAENND